MASISCSSKRLIPSRSGEEMGATTACPVMAVSSSWCGSQPCRTQAASNTEQLDVT